MLNVKRACPNATRNMCGLILEKSGLNMYSNPKCAFGSCSEEMIKNISITANKGIKKLLANSIPFFNPLAVKYIQIKRNVSVKMQFVTGSCVRYEK